MPERWSVAINVTAYDKNIGDPSAVHADDAVVIRAGREEAVAAALRSMADDIESGTFRLEEDGDDA